MEISRRRPDRAPIEVLLPAVGLALLSFVPIVVFATFVQLRFAESVKPRDSIYLICSRFHRFLAVFGGNT